MSRSHITTHVLDVMSGKPAVGIDVALHEADCNGPPLARETTDENGRISALGPAELPVGTYRLVFTTGPYFAKRDQDTFFPEVVLTFSLVDETQHYHIPLLLSPFSYTTYRGN